MTETFLSRCMMSTTMAQMDSTTRQMVVSLTGCGPHTEWMEDSCPLCMVTAQTLSLPHSGCVLASCMSGQGVAVWGWWAGLEEGGEGPVTGDYEYSFVDGVVIQTGQETFSFFGGK